MRISQPACNCNELLPLGIGVSYGCSVTPSRSVPQRQTLEDGVPLTVEGGPQCSDALLRSVSLPSHPDLLAEKLQTRSILTLHLVSFQGVRSPIRAGIRAIQRLYALTGRSKRTACCITMVPDGSHRTFRHLNSHDGITLAPLLPVVQPTAKCCSQVADVLKPCCRSSPGGLERSCRCPDGHAHMDGEATRRTARAWLLGQETHLLEMGARTQTYPMELHSSSTPAGDVDLLALQSLGSVSTRSAT